MMPKSPTPISLGDLERRAGITDRRAFWLPYAKHRDGYERAVDELRRRAGLAPLKRRPAATVTGTQLARLNARQNHDMLAIIAFGLLMALFMSLALVPAGLHRQAAWHFAEARV